MLSYFIAKRLFRHSDDGKHVSRLAVHIATGGVAIGVAVMIVSVCVVLGFQTEISSKMYGIGAHIQVLNYESTTKAETYPIVVNEELMERLSSVPGVRHVQRFCQKGGMLKTDEAFRGVLFHGVGPEYDTDFLSAHLVDGELPAFCDTASCGGLVVSQKMANELQLKVGDRIYAYFFEQNIRARRFTISGIFCTNLCDFDDKLVFTDIYTIHHLWGWDSEQYSGAELLLNDFQELDSVSARVVDAVNHTQDAYGAYYTSPTITELYPAMFSWLSLLDTNVWVILVLMICVSGFTVVSGLLIIILERTNFIGVMKALGANNSLMRRTFLYYASFIVLRGLLYGNLLAFLLVAIQKTTGIVRLNPIDYYVDRVPLLVNWSYIALIDFCTLIISVIALLLPCLIVSGIHPARSIRFE